MANNIVYGNALHGIRESSDGEHGVGPRNRYLDNLAFANRGGGTATGMSLYPGELVSGTINADPRFPHRMPGVGHYRLRASSPAVDAGTCTGAPRLDYRGAARPQGSGVDIGPLERASNRRRCHR